MGTLMLPERSLRGRFANGCHSLGRRKRESSHPKGSKAKKSDQRRGYVKITTKEDGAIIEPLEPTADKYFGAFKIDTCPEDLDEVAVKVMKKRWNEQHT